MLENDSGLAFKKCPRAIPLCLVLVHHHPPLVPAFFVPWLFQLYLQCIATPQHLDRPSPTIKTKKSMHLLYILPVFKLEQIFEL